MFVDFTSVSVWYKTMEATNPCTPIASPEETTKYVPCQLLYVQPMRSGMLGLGWGPGARKWNMYSQRRVLANLNGLEWISGCCDSLYNYVQEGSVSRGCVLAGFSPAQDEASPASRHGYNLRARTPQSSPRVTWLPHLLWKASPSHDSKQKTVCT